MSRWRLVVRITYAPGTLLYMALAYKAIVSMIISFSEIKIRFLGYAMAGNAIAALVIRPREYTSTDAWHPRGRPIWPSQNSNTRSIDGKALTDWAHPRGAKCLRSLTVVWNSGSSQGRAQTTNSLPTRDLDSLFCMIVIVHTDRTELTKASSKRYMT